MGRDKDGNANGAYSLDGLDDHIQVPNSASPTSFIRNTGIFTISAWIKLDDLNKRAAIVSTSGTRVYKGFGLMYETFGQGFGDHQLRFSTADGSNQYFQSLGASNTINDLNWHHVLVTGDGQEIRFYVDGMPDGTPTPITRFSTGDTDKPILIGTFIGVDDNRHAHLGGSIDDVMIFDRALTQAEISQLAQKKTPEEIDQNTSNRQQLAFGQYYRFGFQGQFAEEDGETGWNSFDLRMYDPVIGRWLTVDPDKQFFSPYLALGNNPLNQIDKDGAYSEGNGGGVVLVNLAEIRIVVPTKYGVSITVSATASLAHDGNEYALLLTPTIGGGGGAGTVKGAFSSITFLHGAENIDAISGLGGSLGGFLDLTKFDILDWLPPISGELNASFDFSSLIESLSGGKLQLLGQPTTSIATDEIIAGYGYTLPTMSPTSDGWGAALYLDIGYSWKLSLTDISRLPPALEGYVTPEQWQGALQSAQETHKNEFRNE